MICIAGGGTGGHLAIAKALASELKKAGQSCIFIGSQNGQDKMWFENSELFCNKYFLPSSGVVNKKGFKKLFSLLNILKLAFGCIKIFKEHDIKAIISVGGYSSAPASFGAIFARKPLFIHEQNAVVGRLNLLLKPFAKHFFSSYSKDSDGKTWDYPVKDDFFAFSRCRTELENILFLGGSQGASFINSLALSLAASLRAKNIKILHQCGKNDFEKIKAEYEKMGIDAELFAFCDDMPALMNRADFCVSRAGASSLWELCANALPSVFIPYPHAANDHQFYNAQFLAQKKLAFVLRQNEASAEKILEFIEKIELKSVSEALKNEIKSSAGKEIIDKILKIIAK